MSKPSARRPSIPPRPQLISEQMQTAVNGQIGTVPRVLNRQQCMEFAVMLGANLANLLNNKTQLPWLTTTMDKRSDGFSLHVQVLPVTADSDAVV